MAEFSSLSPHSSIEEENHDPQAIQPPQAVSQLSAPTSGNINSSPQPPLSSSSTGADRKPRDRPHGSKNKPSTPICIALPSIRHLQLLVPRGYDICDLVQNYARKNRVGVRILNGTGKISHFNLLHPRKIVNEECTLITMSGTYVDSSIYNNSIEGGISAFLPSGRRPWLNVFINNNVSDLFGGIVVSGVLAATDVVLHVQTFKPDEFQWLDNGEQDGGSHSAALGGGGSDVGGGFGGGNGSGSGGGELTISAN